MDLKNGIVRIEGKITEFTPRLMKVDFVSSDLYKEVLNEDADIYTNYYLKPQTISGQKFIVRVYFHPSQLISSINLSLTKDESIPSWDSWSEENEKIKKSEHDKWLEKVVGNPPYKYEWGEISSDYDTRSNSSLIIISYYRN